jgi:hypothetical protein
MTLPNISADDELVRGRALTGIYPEPLQAQASAVSWGAIVAGAAIIAHWCISRQLHGYSRRSAA